MRPAWLAAILVAWLVDEWRRERMTEPWWAEYERARHLEPMGPLGPLRRGDYVTVMVLGGRRRARVVDPYTSLGNVTVDLDEPLEEWPGADLRIRRVVRERAEVRRIERRCEECGAPWPDAQCRRCGNRTWEEEP